jgi:hypothetical protein
MSVESISTRTSPYPAPSPGAPRPGRQEMKAIRDALAAGDLGQAQKAFGDLQQLTQSVSPVGTTDGSATARPNNSFVDALKSLGEALQSGNLETAQVAFGKFRHMLNPGHRGTPVLPPSDGTPQPVPGGSVDADGDNDGSRRAGGLNVVA